MYEGARLRQPAGAADVERLASLLCPGEGITECLGLERRLRRDLVEELASVLPFLEGRTARFYHALLKRFQVEELKVILRCLLSELDREEARAGLVDLPAGLGLPVEGLLSSSDVSHFVASIEDEAIGSGARAAMPLYEKTRSKAFIEMGLDGGYWTGVCAALDGLPAWARRACGPPLDNEAFSVRLLCVLRAARVYELEWADVEPLLPPWRDRPSVAALRRVHQDPSPQSVLKNVPRLARLGLSSGDLQSIPELEEALWQATVDIANRQYYGCVDSPAVLVSYFYLRRAEARKLAGIGQLLRYGADRGQIAEFLGVDGNA